MEVSSSPRPLAVVTGASSGIGRELAMLCAQKRYDLIIVADRGPLQEVAESLRTFGVEVETVRADLATEEGISAIEDTIADRPVEALLANAGHGLGHAFLDQDFNAVLHVINTNVVGTLDLVHRVGQGMLLRDSGKILLTGSVAGLVPGSYQAVYNGTKAFIDSFAYALRDELKDTNISVTVLMPGATDTNFFERAGMTDTEVGASEHKAAPAEVAKEGFAAMEDGASDVVAGWKNKLDALLSHVTPNEILAARHGQSAAPGTANRQA